jgi:hypothetical protein
MPRFDGTGPAGMGPMTGGARGPCNPHNARYAGYSPYRPRYAVPPNPNYPTGFGRPAWGLGRGFRGRGRGFGRGRGPGRGRGWW